MFFARYLLTLHLLAIAFQTLLILAILWRQRSLAHRLDRFGWHLGNPPTPTQQNYASYDGPSQVPFPRKWEPED